MSNFKQAKLELIPLVLTVFMLLVSAGCSSVHLGDIDETMDHRDDMPGPGILSDEDGKSKLSWSSKSRSSVAESTGSNAVGMDEINEFELYKDWRKQKSEGENSADYQEFLQWLEFQKFK